MADQHHVEMVKQGSDVWNAWIKAHSDIQPDLSGTDFSEQNLKDIYLPIANLAGCDFGKADLRSADLRGADLRRSSFYATDLRDADLREADLRNADLRNADLRKATLDKSQLYKANLQYARINRASFVEAYLTRANLEHTQLNGANFSQAILYRAQLKNANLRGANLLQTNLTEADLSSANLTNANLMEANLLRTDFSQADLNNCRIYGIAGRNLQLNQAVQTNLIVTPYSRPQIMVDNLKFAQLLALVLESPELYEVVHTITTRCVLILGNFLRERQALVGTLKVEVRAQGYIPLVCFYEDETSENFGQSLESLIPLACMVYVDGTNAKNMLNDLEKIISHIHVPIQLLQAQDDKIDTASYTSMTSVKIYEDDASAFQGLHDLLMHG